MMRAVIAGLLLGVIACTARGPLSAEGFGSIGDDEADEADKGEQDGPDSIGDASDDNDSEPDSSNDDPDSPSSDDPSESTNDDSSSNTDDSSSSNDSFPDSSGDDPSEELADTDPSDETWGIPPDVTNEPCAPLAQDCFPTHKCVPFSTVQASPFLDANKCMPILGDKGWGEPCTLSSFNEGQDDCDGTGFCWNLEWVDGELHGTCVPFCTGSPQSLMCPAGWGCLFSGAVALCNKQCDPLLQDCPAEYGCYWSQNAFQCALTGSQGHDISPCDQPNDCQPGLVCVAQEQVPGCPGNESTCCTPLCDLDLADPCASPRECVAFFEQGQAPVGFQDVGVCVLP